MSNYVSDETRAKIKAIHAKVTRYYCPNCRKGSTGRGGLHTCPDCGSGLKLANTLGKPRRGR